MWNAISLVQVWTRVAVSISYDDNHYTTGTSNDDNHYNTRVILCQIQFLFMIHNLIFWRYLILNELLEIICLHTVKWLQVLLFNVSNSICQVFVCKTNNLNPALWFQITNDNIPKQMIE